MHIKNDLTFSDVFRILLLPECNQHSAGVWNAKDLLLSVVSDHTIFVIITMYL